MNVPSDEEAARSGVDVVDVEDVHLVGVDGVWVTYSNGRSAVVGEPGAGTTTVLPELLNSVPVGMGPAGGGTGPHGGQL